MKDREQDFLKRKCSYRLVDGTIRVRIYPDSACRKCAARRVAAWKEKKKAQGTYTEMLRRWYKARDPRERKKYARLWYRRRRGDNLHHVWSKYEKELANLFVFDPVKLVAYIDRFLREDPFDQALSLNGIPITDVESAQLARWRRGETKTVTLEQADKWATRFDLPLWEFEEVAMIAA